MIEAREGFYLTCQIICILAFMAWACVLSVRVRRITDKKLRLYYIGQLVGILLINLRLITQITDRSVYNKSFLFFIGSFILCVSAFLTIRKYNEQDKTKTEQ